MKSDAEGGEGDKPRRFRISAITVSSIEFGTGAHSLKCVDQMALPAVAPLIDSDKSNVSEAGISPCITDK